MIILSNLGQEQEIQRGLDAGAAAYIVKANASTDDITAKVGELIRGR